MKVDPFRIVAGVGFVAWVAWMISVQVDYEESWEPAESAPSEAADPAPPAQPEVDPALVANELASDGWAAEDLDEQQSDDDWGTDVQ